MDSKTNEILQKFSSQKVDLSNIIQQRNAMFKVAEKIISNGRNLIDEFENNKKRADRQIKSLDQMLGKVENIFNKEYNRVQIAAKDLGIAMNDIPNFEKFFNAYYYIEKEVRNLKENIAKYK